MEVREHEVTINNSFNVLQSEEVAPAQAGLLDNGEGGKEDGAESGDDGKGVALPILSG